MCCRIYRMSALEDSRVFGPATRELWELFQHHGGHKGHVTICDIRQALNSISVFPSQSQVHEFVSCACESNGRIPADHLTFGEFAFMVTALEEYYRHSPPAPLPKSQLKDKEERRKRRRPSGYDVRFRVFLGGSCNPTTWRHDIAIPFLKENGITFYNPQVQNWKPELIEIEDRAKQIAEVLFFVIDNQTRSTSSMVEAAYLAGCGRQLILVINSFTGPGTLVAGEPISSVEFEDLERSHTYLIDLVERQGIPVFREIKVALQCTRKAVKQHIHVSDMTTEDGAQPVKHAHIRVADRYLKLKDVFTSLDTSNSGKISLQDVGLAYRTITDDDLPAQLVSKSEPNKMFSFDDFCAIVAEYRYKRKGFLNQIYNTISRMSVKMFDWMRGIQPLPSSEEEEPRRRDIFLGGTCGRSRWREEVAIPLLRKHGLSFFNPLLPNWSTKYIPLEAAVKDNCRLLLYVVTGETRAVTSMLEVGYYIGQGCNIVLCIEPIMPSARIEDEVLSERALKDYNRARSYLADLANREGVPVFDKVTEAVECAAKKLLENRDRS